MIPPSATTTPTATKALREPVIQLPAVENEGHAERDDQVQAKERERDPPRRTSVQDAETDGDRDDPPHAEKIDQSEETREHAGFGQHRKEHTKIRGTRHADGAAGKLNRDGDR